VLTTFLSPKGAA